ncbi:Periplasmic pH-dependent serine endoprotease DegQ [Polaribacter huanghezhanensis]|uniref:S1C family serine protease n=1 Tax=Polaribacter huanghezhanensis TaxID=1354726 RepID=UPI0026485457|nr:trypsin-like peptidase domain-containing protein [Polaribacter huanghezhanensis]WKD87050.1 Periplasmic pH-dependent serine endoprotease DegQ [Polaribacter huanghezhanensis]
MKKTASLLSIAILGGILTLSGYKLFIEKPQVFIERTTEPSSKIVKTSFTNTNLSATNAPSNFTEAAEKTVHAVVHVKNTAIKTQSDPWAELFYGRGSGARKYEQVGTGSGVIISEDGYIVTNNHVIDGASDLEVTLNNQKKYKAKLIGTDTENDIALLKINADIKLPYIPFANSDALKIGEWVLAVGNPYNLTSTVTAGIVSAKGRDLKGNTNVDSFIQTDAAVNPGNSGGALVNTRGELVGINTAITSKTGSFIGYSFAVPSNIAKKVIEDLMEFGKVQQSVLGINFDPEYTEEGVKIDGFSENSGAKKGGLKVGDIIKKINRVNISKLSDLKGQLNAKRPGDFVDVIVDRNGDLITKKVKLSKPLPMYISKAFNWELKNLTKKELKKYGISHGVRIYRTNDDNSENSLKNYILLKVNDTALKDAEKAVAILDEIGKDMRYKIFIDMMNVKGEKERIRFR